MRRWVWSLVCGYALVQAWESAGAQVERPSPRVGNRRAWRQTRLDVRYAAEPADRAFRQLAADLNVLLWMSPTAQARLGERRVTWQADDLTAAQAFRWLARLSGAQVGCFEQGVYVTAAPSCSVVWAMFCRAQSPMAGEASAPAGSKLASVDLLDGTASATVRTIGRAFGVNVVCLPSAAECQKLVTLRSQGVTLRRALASLSRQTGLAVQWIDGAYALGSSAEVAKLAESDAPQPRTNRPNTGRGGPTDWPSPGEAGRGAVLFEGPGEDVGEALRLLGRGNGPAGRDGSGRAP